MPCSQCDAPTRDEYVQQWHSLITHALVSTLPHPPSLPVSAVLALAMSPEDVRAMDRYIGSLITARLAVHG